LTDTWERSPTGTKPFVDDFPIVADDARKVAQLYSMVTEEDMTWHKLFIRFAAPICGIFIIDPHKKIRLSMMYPASTGHSSAEVLRAVDALQEGCVRESWTPVDWTSNDDDSDGVILPAVAYGVGGGISGSGGGAGSPSSY
jgi:alkyl hydroperoxide reductase subunit AhpC